MPITAGFPRPSLSVVNPSASGRHQENAIRCLIHRSDGVGHTLDVVRYVSYAQATQRAQRRCPPRWPARRGRLVGRDVSSPLLAGAMMSLCKSVSDLYRVQVYSIPTSSTVYKARMSAHFSSVSPHIFHSVQNRLFAPVRPTKIC